MPVKTLPSHLKNMKTMDVQLTKTTEEEIWLHFVNRFTNLEEEYEYIHKALDKAINYMYENNPYYKYNWRKCIPERMYKCLEWLTTNYESNAIEKFWSYYELKSDLKRCNGEFKWTEDETKSVECCNMLYIIDRLLEQTKEKQNELNDLEKTRFEQAKQEWLERDKVWIEEQKLIKGHSYHHPKEYYIQLFKKDKNAEIFYNGIIPNHSETCKYCIAEADYKRIQDEKEKKDLEEQEQRNREWLEQKEREREESRQVKQVMQNYECPDCNFHTVHKFNFDNHMDSKEHAQMIKCKSLFCKDCEIQCRSIIEYNHHIHTSKHKKKAGQLEEDTLYCTICNHTATTKQNYQTHLKSKKHLQKVNDSNI